jgi:hypothetical protein
MNHATLSLMPPNSVMSRDLHQGVAIVAAGDPKGAATNRKCHNESPSRPVAAAVTLGATAPAYADENDHHHRVCHTVKVHRHWEKRRN